METLEQLEERLRRVPFELRSLGFTVEEAEKLLGNYTGLNKKAEDYLTELKNPVTQTTELVKWIENVK